MTLRALLLPAILATAINAQAAGTHMVIVTGLGGEKYYSELFHRWASTLGQVAASGLGLSPDRIIRLAEDPSRDPEFIAATSSKPNLLQAIQRVAEDADDGDIVALFYLGHATARGDRTLLNLPGPDVSATELSSALDALSGKTVVVVIAAPASAPFIDTLSGANRIVITATASASENQHTRFGGHFIDALVENSADLNKDKQVSVLEAFQYANREIAHSFQVEGRIRTEHALLDDNGDREGTRDPEANRGDGQLAARVYLRQPDDILNASSGVEVLALQIQARRLVDRIESVKRKKRTLEPDDYLEQLEALLVELALNRRAYRKERRQ